MSDIGTICKECKNATQIIQGPHLCPDCYVDKLENENEQMKTELEGQQRYKEMYRKSEEKVSEYFKYKLAFEMLVREVRK